MPTFLQPVDLPERCFLFEVLLWVAFQRLPVASYTYDGKEVRETNEVGNDAINQIDDVLTSDETGRAGVPDDPTWVALSTGSTTVGVSAYDGILARDDLEEDFRRKLEGEREVARAYERACADWEAVHYKLAIEYPASRIFVALKDGTLRARGRLLPIMNGEEAIIMLDAENRSIYDLTPTDIPPSSQS